MNANIFRLVFNKKTGQLVPVAEITTCNSKGSAGSAASGVGGVPQSSNVKGLLAWSLINAAAAAAFLTIPIVSGNAIAADVLPTQGNVVNGNATVNVNGRVMTVQQLSQVLGVNWQSFSIGAGNTVVFQQPNASSVAINRVIGNSRSEIFGSLQANGQVFLLNQNGVLFGKGSEVSVGGLLASTAADATKNANGQWVLSGGSSNGVINQGNIKAADGGYVVLAGGKAINEGNITATQGAVALAAGGGFTLSLDNASLLAIKVDEATLNALAENKGLIQADGGAVYLTSKGRDSLLNTVVNNEGLIQARSLGFKNGKVVLMAEGGDALTSGTIDVSGQNAGEKAGAVVIGGNRVGVFGNATIDASGVAGGGRVVIGGDLLGKATDVANISLADNTVIGSGATIKIGSAQGDGGFVETSGKTLTMLGTVEGKSAGKNGEWLIDPTDITISTAASTATNTSNTWEGSGSTAIVNNASIEGALNTGADVTVTTAGAGSAGGNITVAANINKTAGGNANLTLNANQSITLNNGVNITSNSGSLNLTMNASQSSNASVVTLNGNEISTNGTVRILNLNSAVYGSAAVVMNGNNTLNAGSGSIFIDGQQPIFLPSLAGGVKIGGNLTTAGNVTLNGYGTGTGGHGVWIDNGTIKVVSGVLNVTGRSGGQNAVRIENSSLNTEGGILNINGNSSQVNILGISSLDSSGGGVINVSTVDLSPSANTRTAVTLGGNLSTNGTVNIHGSTQGNGSTGTNVTGNITVLGGTTTITGNQSWGGGNALVLASGSSITSTAGGNAIVNVTQTGSTNLSLAGTTLTGNVALNSNASIVMSGNNSLNSTNGTVAVNADIPWETTARTAISIGGNLNTSGQVNITGRSLAAATGVGVLIAGNVAASNGTLNVRGTQVLGTYLSMAGANVTTSNATVNFLGDRNLVTSGTNTLDASAGGQINLNATDSNGTNSVRTAVTLGGNLSTNGVVNIRGLAQGAGSTGTNVTGNITLLGGTTTITGNQSWGLGNAMVLASGSSITSTAGGNAIVNVTQTGNTNLSLAGTTLTGNVALNSNASIVMSGSNSLNGTSGAVTINTNLSTALGNLTTNGNVAFNTSSGNGNITQAASTALTSAGNLSLTTGSGNITLSNTVNNLSSSINLNTSGTFTADSTTGLMVNSSGALRLSGLNAVGDINVSTTTGNLTLNGNVVSTGGDVTLTAGAASAVASSATANGAVTGGDVVKGSATSVTAGSGKTVALYSGNANSSALATLVTNGDTSQNKAYATNVSGGVGIVNASKALNLFYRVTPSLTVTSATAQNRVYDATTSVNVTGTISGAIDGDVPGSIITGTFADKNVGNNKTINLGAVSVAGANSGVRVVGYQATSAGSLTANVTAATLQVTGVTANNKVYDATTVATLGGAATVAALGSDVVTVGGTGAATFDNKNVGAGKAVAVTGFTLAGADAGNYVVVQPTSLTANITKADISAVTGITAANKVYDATTAATLNTSAAGFTGKIGSDVLNVSAASGAFADKNAGAGKNVSITGITLGGADAGNYNLVSSTASTTADISKADISAVTGITAANKVYDA
ncbi:YDG domain-containing protein, partial [Limnohabitans sp. Rim8]|uniref:beta strand repeat-containing protein n=1 Tax=Limnohabitans sp. Rim8 TaxID=1100718 RepID=UPI002624E3C4